MWATGQSQQDQQVLQVKADMTVVAPQSQALENRPGVELRRTSAFKEGEGAELLEVAAVGSCRGRQGETWVCFRYAIAISAAAPCIPRTSWVATGRPEVASGLKVQM